MKNVCMKIFAFENVVSDVIGDGLGTDVVCSRDVSEIGAHVSGDLECLPCDSGTSLVGQEQSVGGCAGGKCGDSSCVLPKNDDMSNLGQEWVASRDSCRPCGVGELAAFDGELVELKSVDNSDRTEVMDEVWLANFLEVSPDRVKRLSWADLRV